MSRALDRQAKMPPRDGMSGWDSRFRGPMQFVQPAEYAVSADPSMTLGTLLGSCVSACICDPVARIGGLNHFLLPVSDAVSASELLSETRYGVHAMEMLINGIIRLGGRRDRLVGKLFGGANIIRMSRSPTIGERNQIFASEFLASEGIPVKAREMGGASARRIFFQPALNKVYVQTAGDRSTDKVREIETRLKTGTPRTPGEGEVELF